MNILGEIQYAGEKKSFMNTYYTNISFTLQDVQPDELTKLNKTIVKYLENKRDLSRTTILQTAKHSHYSNPDFTLKIEGNGLVNIFIKGEEAETIEQELLKLINTEENLESRV